VGNRTNVPQSLAEGASYADVPQLWRIARRATVCQVGRTTFANGLDSATRQAELLQQVGVPLLMQKRSAHRGDLVRRAQCLQEAVKPCGAQ
jgi:hypothetical protein